jgi:hypothetical protein
VHVGDHLILEAIVVAAAIPIKRKNRIRLYSWVVAEPISPNHCLPPCFGPEKGAPFVAINQAKERYYTQAPTAG